MKASYFIVTTLLITSLQITQAQITTAEVKIEDNGGITSIDGNVGIGTTNPGSKLHVAGHGAIIKLQDTTHEDTSNAFRGWLGGYDKSGDEIWWIGEGSGSGKSLGFYTERDGYDLKIFNKGSGITINNNGNVGIGTNSPELSKLEIRTNNDFKIRLSDNTNYDYWDFITAGNFFGIHNSGAYKFTINNNGNVGIGTNSPELSKLEIRTNNDFKIRLSDNTNYDYWDFITAGNFFGIHNSGAYKFTINSSGNVGIGTTNPTEKLHVAGKIRATGQVGWPDYVFHDDYQLPKLTEVESHIKEKGHLKDIPSEKEVLKNGIDLTEMDARLLQKIEELTLYLIEQNKQNEVQRQQIQLLQKQVNTLKQHTKSK